MPHFNVTFVAKLVM